MNAEAVHELLEPVLRERLGPFGFERVEVNLEPEAYGEPAWEVLVFYGEGAPEPGGDDLLDTVVAARDALLVRGEERFPLLRHRFHGDVIGVQ